MAVDAGRTGAAQFGRVRCWVGNVASDRVAGCEVAAGSDVMAGCEVAAEAMAGPPAEDFDDREGSRARQPKPLIKQQATSKSKPAESEGRAVVWTIFIERFRFRAGCRWATTSETIEGKTSDWFANATG